MRNLARQQRLNDENRAWLQENRDKLMKYEATDRATRVAIVDKKWHDELSAWLAHGTTRVPGKINTKSLMTNDKLSDRAELGVDFEVVPEKLWDGLTQIFGKSPAIVRQYVQHPSTGKAHIIRDAVQVKIDKGDRVVQKAAEKDWIVRDVKQQFCRALGVNGEDYAFCRPNTTTRIHESRTVKHVMDNYPGSWVFLPRSETHSASRTHSTLRRMPRDQSLTDEEPPLRTRRAIQSPVRSISAPVLSPMPVGFLNLGNTCFFNSAVQCLLRTGPLIDIVLSEDFESRLNTHNPKGSGGKIARACRSLLQEMCGRKASSISPSDLHHAICRKYPRFRDYGQHDSQELLCALLDCLHEDMNQAAGSPKPLAKGADSWANHIAQNSSPIVDAFHGTLCNTIECPNCGYKSVNRDPFVFLSVPIPKTMRTVKLQDCLSEFSKVEVLDSKNMWECDKCKKKVQATKRMFVQRCADVLIIHLKRFSGYGWASRKISTPVEYPDILNASMISENLEGSSYKLIGAVFHSGSLIGGHYTSAAIDRSSDQWYYFNDSHCREIDQRQAHAAGAYILFYQKCQ